MLACFSQEGKVEERNFPWENTAAERVMGAEGGLGGNAPYSQGGLISYQG